MTDSQNSMTFGQFFMLHDHFHFPASVAYGKIVRHSPLNGDLNFMVAKFH